MKPLAAAAVLAAYYQKITNQELYKILLALNSVIDVSLEKDYPGNLLQVPMYANKAVSFSLCKDKSEYKKYLRAAVAEDTLVINQDDTTITVDVCIYRIREEDKVRIAMYIQDVSQEFFVRYIETPDKMKKFLNYPNINVESHFTLQDKSGTEIEMVLYKSQQSDMSRLAIVPPESMEIDFNETWISNRLESSDAESFTELF